MKRGLGDRMKSNYENRNKNYLTRRIPVIIRVDGRAFHTFTARLKKPFDLSYIRCIDKAAESVAAGMQGCVAYYSQSDEVSFLLMDNMNNDTQAWFDYNKSKIETIAASSMTYYFNELKRLEGISYQQALFDARSFNIPKDEVPNYFLWRARDWYRNSVGMLAGSLYSSKELENKSVEERKKMILIKGGDWDALAPRLKGGNFRVLRDGYYELRTIEDYNQVKSELGV